MSSPSPISWTHIAVVVFSISVALPGKAQELESGEIEQTVRVNPLVEGVLRRMPGPKQKTSGADAPLIASLVGPELRDDEDIDDEDIEPAAEVITEPRQKETSEASSDPGTESEEADPTKDAIQQFALQDAFLRNAFVNKNGQWFTRYNRGVVKIPYQLSGFQLIGPDEADITEADAKNGIDRRADYLFLIHSFRTYSKGTGWSSWTPGNPPKLTGMSMVRQNGEWKIENTEDFLYSVN